MSDGIYVRLVNEVIDVWRPVEAVRIDVDVYLIVPQVYDRAIESWEFGPGDVVRCQLIATDDGTIIAATSKA